MKTYWEPGGCTLVDCPKCGKWLDADAEECACGWAIEGLRPEESMYYEEDYEPPEEEDDVSEP